MPNRCMALLKFSQREEAKLFMEEYNGKPFWVMLEVRKTYPMRRGPCVQN
jgi:BRCA1-associated protein 2